VTLSLIAALILKPQGLPFGKISILKMMITGMLWS